jgi:hypothetical protein
MMTQALPAVPLKIWLSVCGIKPDRVAGFVSFAKRQKLGPMSIPEWAHSWQNFLKRPVK